MWYKFQLLERNLITNIIFFTLQIEYYKAIYKYQRNRDLNFVNNAKIVIGERTLKLRGDGASCISTVTLSASENLCIFYKESDSSSDDNNTTCVGLKLHGL